MAEQEGAAPSAEDAARAALADAVLVDVDQAYGAFLSPEQREEVRRRVQELIRLRAGLRRAPLANGDAPAWQAGPTAGPRLAAPAAAAFPASPATTTVAGSIPPADGRQWLAFATVTELGRLLRSGETDPVELAELALERLERLGPRLNAVVTLTPERALREARRAKEELAAGQDRGPLHGIPYGAKDLLATAGGTPTSWGAAPYRDQQFAEDAAVLQRLEAAGAVLVAKLAMVELAGGFGYNQPDASFTGPGRNPWDVEHWSGGSSSGSGSAVAAGLVPFAIGSETWGSITTPSALCGLAGFRPTFGRVPTRGAMVLSWSLDKLGPMCRSALDCALALEAMAGADPADPADRTLGWRFDRRGPERPFRLAVARGLPAHEQLQPEVRERFGAALETLRGVGTITEVDLPDLPVVEATRMVLAAEMASAFEEFLAGGGPASLTAPEDRAGGYANLAVRAIDYLRAMRLRRHVAGAYAELLAPYDALLAPTLAGAGARIGQSFSASGWTRAPRAVRDLGAAGNLVGLPAITVPSGPDGAGLPTALAFVGPAFGEQRVLDVAVAYQQRTAWHNERPAW